MVKDGALLLMFVDEFLMSLTDWVNNTFFDFLFLGIFSLGDDTIWLVWVSNLSEVPLRVCILAYMEIYITVNYLCRVE